MSLGGKGVRELTEGWGEGEWAERLRCDPLVAQRPGLSSGGWKYVADMIDAGFSKGVYRDVHRWLVLASALSGDRPLDKHVSDLFRPSKTKATDPKKLGATIERASSECLTLGLATSAVTLASWASYGRLHGARVAEDRAIVVALKRRPQLIAWIMMLLEEAFSDGVIPSSPSGEDAPEEIATAASYALYLADEAFGLHPRFFSARDWSAELRATAERVLAAAARSRRVMDMEIGVYRYAYRCEDNGRGEFQITAPSPEFQKTLQLGYIKTGMLAVPIASPEGEPSTAKSFLALCEKFVERFPNFFALTTDDMPRLEMKMPEQAVRLMGEQLFAPNVMFQEDLQVLRHVCYEINATFDELENTTLADNLTLMDMFVIGRILRFHGFARWHALRRIRAQDLNVYARSIMGSTSVEQLVEVLKVHGVDEQKARAYLDIVSWMPSSEKLLDLQYTPLLSFPQMLLVPFVTLGTSNVIRNAMYVKRRRVHEDGTFDPVAHQIAEALGTRTKLIRQGLSYKWNGVAGELDVLAVVDGTLYAFECKNTLEPTNSFEQRTFFDYLDTAVEQLDRFLSLWGSVEFRDLIARQLGWDLSKIVAVRTAIVPSIRLLSGAKFGGHPVRHSRELSNYVTKGKARVVIPGGDRAGEYEADLWAGKEFSGALIERYLEDSNAVYDPFWRSFNRDDEELLVGGARVKIERYGLSLLEYAKVIEQSQPLRRL